MRPPEEDVPVREAEEFCRRRGVSLSGLARFDLDVFTSRHTVGRRRLARALELYLTGKRRAREAGIDVGILTESGAVIMPAVRREQWEQRQWRQVDVGQMYDQMLDVVEAIHPARHGIKRHAPLWQAE